jgi:hypothetical protein
MFRDASNPECCENTGRGVELILACTRGGGGSDKLVIGFVTCG